MSMIVYLYNKFTGEIIRQEKMSDDRAKNVNIYNFSPKGIDTLLLKLKLLKDDKLQPLMETNMNKIELYPKKNRRLEMGIIFHGGLGDHVIARAIIEGLKDLHGNIIIDAYCYKSAEILNTFEEIRETSTLAPNVDPKSFAKNLSLKYEVVYVLGLLGARYENGRLAYTKYPDLYAYYPNNLEQIHLKFPYKHIVFIRGESIGLRHIQIDDIDIRLHGSMGALERWSVGAFSPVPQRPSAPVPHLPTCPPALSIGDYVTISGFSVSKVKEWDKWEEVVDFLQKRDISVIQLGLPDSSLFGNSLDRRGVSISDVEVLLSGAFLHLDIDGGLVHLARAIGTRSLVLFGATNMGNWGYWENKTLFGEVDCPFQPCFGKEQWKNCPFTEDEKGFCMKSISLEKVLYGID